MEEEEEEEQIECGMTECGGGAKWVRVPWVDLYTYTVTLYTIHLQPGYVYI
jgi:hypothetical protein